MKRPSKKTTLGAVILAVGLGAGTLLGRYLFYPNAVGSLATPDLCGGLGTPIIPKLLPGSPVATVNWVKNTEEDLIMYCDVQTPDGDVFISATNYWNSMKTWKADFPENYNVALKDATTFKSTGDAAESWQNQASTYTYCNKLEDRRPVNIEVTVKTRGSARGSGQEHRRLVAELAAMVTKYAQNSTYCALREG